MSVSVAPKLIERSKRNSQLLGFLAGMIGVLNLVGWQFDVLILKSVLPGLVSMKPNTSVALIFASIALWLVSSELPRKNQFKYFFAIMISLIGSLTFLEYLTGWELGIDTLLFTEKVKRDMFAAAFAGRMSIATALCFSFLGLALLLDGYPKAWAKWSKDYLTLATLTLVGLGLLGHLYNVDSFSMVFTSTQIAVNTAGSIVLLSLGLFMTHPTEGIMALWNSPLSGGVMVRRLLPITIVFLISFGWLRLLGQKMEFYGTEMGVAILVTVSIITLGSLIWFTAHSLDQSDKDRLQKEEKIYFQASLLEQVRNMVIISSPDRRVMYWNTFAEKQLGWTTDEIIGKPSSEVLLPPESAAKIQEIGQGIQKTGSWEGELLAKKKDGSIIPVWTSISPLFNEKGEMLGNMGVSVDISELKRTQDELSTLNQELEQRVLERTAQLEVANRELEAFSYSVSHDLRAPLRGIGGFCQVLLEDYSAQLDSQGQGYLERVRSASQKMGHLIDDMLGLSKISRSEMNYQVVDLSELTKTIREELEQTEPERQVEWQVQPGMKARGDKRLLQIALTNLLGNAWKFTAKKPEARIEFGQTVQDGQPIYFIRDNGAGFEMAYASKLFAAFQRLHTVSDFPGTGIGLVTIQRIISRHGGKVWAEGVVGQGAVFYFTLRKEDLLDAV